MMHRLGHVWPMQSEGERLQALLLPSELYHENSKLTRADWEAQQHAQQDPLQRVQAQRAHSVLQSYYDLIQYGAKRYPHAPRIALPPAPESLQQDVGMLLRQRRSVRQLSGKPMSLAQLATLLYYSYGISRYEDGQQQSYPHRVVPSGGGLYNLEVYVLVFSVADLEPGAYHYEAYSHGLERIVAGEPHDTLRQSLLYEELLHGPAVALVVSGVFDRPRFKYGELGYRLTLLEAGHVGQNVCLTATALGLGACPVAGFVEDTINDLLGLDGVDETAVYLFVVGAPQPVSESPQC